MNELLGFRRASICGVFLSLAGASGLALMLQSPQEPKLKEAPLGSRVTLDPEATLFGISIAALGDVDGDGEEEVAIGAPVAWAEKGRPGAVLIVGVKSQRVLRVLYGPDDGSFFGKSICALRLNPKSKSAMLGVDLFGVFDPATGAATLSIPGEKIRGVQNDLDGDGLCEVVANQTISSRTGKVIEGSPQMQGARLLSIDIDGDGFWDVLHAPKRLDHGVAFSSGITGKELRRLVLPTTFSDEFDGFSAVSAQMDLDGHRDLVMTLPDFESHSSQLLVCSGPMLDQRRSIRVAVSQVTLDSVFLPERYCRPLYNCGDLNADGVDDILAAAVDWHDLTLTCYSGVDGSAYWKSEKAVEEHFSSVVSTSDLDGDGVPEILSGAVLYLRDGPQFGLDGCVHILSGKTGAKLKDIEERKFPQISFRRR